MFAEGVAEGEGVAFVEGEVDFAFLEVDFGVVAGFDDGAVEEIEVEVEGDGGGFEAAVAGGLEFDGEVALDADFAEGIAEEFGLAGGAEAALLADFLGERNLAGGVGDVEVDGVVFEFGEGKDQGQVPATMISRRWAEGVRIWGGRGGW